MVRSKLHPAGRKIIMNQSGMSGDHMDHKKYYKPKGDHPSFNTNMTTSKLGIQLARIENIKTDPRYKWTRSLEVQLLTRNMSEELRKRIEMSTGIDPKDYEHSRELAAIIEKTCHQEFSKNSEEQGRFFKRNGGVEDEG